MKVVLKEEKNRFEDTRHRGSTLSANGLTLCLLAPLALSPRMALSAEELTLLVGSILSGFRNKHLLVKVTETR